MSENSKSFDVVVVGAGLAGYCAALEAAAHGATVLLVERESKVGGSSVLSGGSFAFAGTAAQKAAGIEDSSSKLAEDMLKVGAHANDPELVGVYASNQLQAYEWLVEHGVQFGPIIAGSGQSVPRLHPANPREVVRLLGEKAAGQPRIQLMLSARVVRLLRDRDGEHEGGGDGQREGDRGSGGGRNGRAEGDGAGAGRGGGAGRVSRVRIERDGASFEVAVERGVVLTTGGFSRNESMLEQFVPAQAAAKRVGGAGSQGDGLKLAWELGAGVRDMGYIKGTFGNHPAAHSEQHTAMLAIYKGAIAVNKLGRRFANESISYKLLGDACLQQPGAVGYQILDQGIMDQAVPQAPMFNFPKRLEEGLLLKADTLAELARKIDVDPAALQATVEEYNRGVASGEDAFGRTGIVQGYGDLVPIERAPFYAYPSTSAIIATYCGLTVAPTMQVLNVFGEPIAGLYAAGEVTGGFHGKAFMTGTSLGKNVICGRLAGANCVPSGHCATTSPGEERAADAWERPGAAVNGGPSGRCATTSPGEERAADAWERPGAAARGS
jgi:fumarate reductase flavoprotein subunit